MAKPVFQTLSEQLINWVERSAIPNSQILNSDFSPRVWTLMLLSSLPQRLFGVNPPRFELYTTQFQMITSVQVDQFS